MGDILEFPTMETSVPGYKYCKNPKCNRYGARVWTTSLTCSECGEGYD